MVEWFRNVDSQFSIGDFPALYDFLEAELCVRAPHHSKYAKRRLTKYFDDDMNFALLISTIISYCFLHNITRNKELIPNLKKLFYQDSYLLSLKHDNHDFDLCLDYII